MTAYEELLEFGGERIFDFLKNARLHESQFKYSEFNEVCYKKMYIENNQDSIKTVKELKEGELQMADTVSRSWFAVFPNPEQHGYEGSPEDIIEKLKQEWIGSNPLRKGWWGYCISEKGLPHVHMVLEDTGSCRFTKVKKAYPTAHLEPTKGNKKQVLAYIKKEPPFDEKGEQVLVFTSYGNIEGNKRFAVSNTNDTLATIEMLIEEGMTPNQIMAEDIRLRREENLIRKCYFAKRYKETPPIRTVKVVWHCGDSGCGKSYSYIDLCEKYGDDLVYFFSDYANRGVGGFDGYCGEPYLFMDELKQDSLPFELLLTITQGYRSQIHCRYSNCITLWNEVHITSIFSPEDIYAGVVSRENQGKDTIKQLLRRITKYVYHYKVGDEYKAYELAGDQYIDFDDLKRRATGTEFMQIDDEDIPFD